MSMLFLVHSKNQNLMSLKLWMEGSFLKKTNTNEPCPGVALFYNIEQMICFVASNGADVGVTDTQ